MFKMDNFLFRLCSGIIIAFITVTSPLRAETYVGCVDNVGGDALRHCYVLYHTRYPWQEALRQCQSRGERLAVIPEQQVQTLLGGHIVKQMAYAELTWVAGREDTTQQAWYWLDGTKHRGQVQADDGHSTCAILKVDHARKLLVRGVHCSGRRHFLCMYPPEKCGSGGGGGDRTIWGSDGKCYTTVTERETSEKTWYQARDYCLVTGGDLASFPDMDNLEGALTTIIGTDAEYWVGLRVRRWVWQMGTGSEEMLFTAWQVEQPDNPLHHCLALKGDMGQWDDRDCDHPHSYICETVSEIPTTTTTTTTRTTTITTPTAPRPEPSTSSASSSTGGDDVTGQGTEAVTGSEQPRTGDVTAVRAEWLSLGILVAIILIAIVVFIVIIVVGIIICSKKKRSKQEEKKKHTTYDNMTFYHYGDTMPSHLPATPMASYADIIQKHRDQQSSESISGDSGVVECVSSDNLVSEIIGEVQVVHLDIEDEDEDDPPPSHPAPPPPPLPRKPRAAPSPRHHIIAPRETVYAATQRESATYAAPEKRSSSRPPSARDLRIAGESTGMREVPVDCGDFPHYHRYTKGAVTKV